MVENSYYERKIKYLDLMESEERKGSAGFVKIEVKGMGINLLINVKGLHPTDTYEREVLLQTAEGEVSVGRIALKEGQGQFQYRTTMDHSQLQGIRIVLGGTREICCQWQEKQRVLPTDKTIMRKEIVQEDERQVTGMSDSGSGPEEGEKQHNSQSPQKPREIQIIPWDEVRAVEESLERVEKSMSKPEKKGTWRAAEKTPEKATEKTTEKTEEQQEKRVGSTRETAVKQVKRSASASTPGSAKRPVRLMEDKWQQIWAIYPHIHPFQDEREYLSISPADFVLLPGEAYRAANNSFLLHGYYNYDHLILTRIEKRGEVSYYIGVPGNYYEREKQVAVMFGFESFECGTEPAQAGDFGYYMMRTQL